MPALVFGPLASDIAWGLLDFTRPISTMPMNAGRDLGVVPAPEAEAVDRFEAEIDVEILVGEQLVRWAVPVVFVSEETVTRWGLLGFLDHFDVLLRGPLSSFTIEPAGELPPSRYR